MNNLYGRTMIASLPTHDFKWVDDLDVSQIGSQPEAVLIKNNSEKHQKLKKILLTFREKKNYVIHYKTLQLYLSLGIKIKKIHRVLSFKQSEWLKSYIDLNTEMRTKASNDFEKDFYKLMNNSVFGKTMESIRKRCNIKVLNDYDKIEREIAKPTFKNRTIFTEKMVALHMTKEKLKFDKPIYVGMSILDLSKYFMHDFHYNVMKKKYGDNIEVCYTDTDSFVYNIKCEDFYKDMELMIEHFYTSNFPEDHWMPKKNKKVLGKMKEMKIMEKLWKNISV
ncbi:hypothetical protein LAZ67_5000504 [Cordylochernes scorpioides]|uniref:DNA-directed DNA polymerase n=1 Tax=Cordylochernes scorpioides TaxID=51811 RepID=A0ABY6KIH6_9ARAC|nr:hypothetical protein LAZ67_5000504 [Cordylochernes scorpioides]